jgi:hypothetical protein
LSEGLIQPLQKLISQAIFVTSVREPVGGDWQVVNGKSLEYKNYCFVLTVRISRVNLVSSCLLRLHVVTSIPLLSTLDMLHQAVLIRVIFLSISFC